MGSFRRLNPMIVLLMLLFTKSVSAENLWLSPSNLYVSAGKTSAIEIECHNWGDEPIKNITIRAEAPDGLRFRLLTTKIDQLRNDEERILYASVAPDRTVFRRTETVSITFESDTGYEVKQIQVRVGPLPWFWPTVGLSIGLIVILAFYAVFRRLSGGD